MTHPRTWRFQILLGASMLLVTSAMAEPDAPPVDAVAAEESLDHYLGWYRLPVVDRKTREPREDLHGYHIPIFKRGERYYTVMRWMEVPLRAEDGKLVFGFEPTSMAGTSFDHDPVTGEFFFDPLRSAKRGS